jgi:hypothetical protein
MSEQIDSDLLSTATDCIELISKRRRINESVTNQFMTNIIDINKQDLTTLTVTQEEEKMTDLEGGQPSTSEDKDLNLRFIKPSKYFYNSLMGVWLKFDKQRLNTLTFEEFVSYLKKHSQIFMVS